MTWSACSGGKPRGEGTQDKATSPTLRAYGRLSGLEEVVSEWDLKG